MNLVEDGVQNLSISCLVKDVSDLHFSNVNFFRLCLVSCKASHVARMCGMSSGCCLHAEDRRQHPDVFFDQLLQSISVRYLPEIILACTVAIEILDGEDPAEDHRG